MGNPFVDAFVQSDWMGKTIFILLFALSLLTWAIFFETWSALKRAKKGSVAFKKIFERHREMPLHIDPEVLEGFQEKNPFLALYSSLRTTAFSFIKRNRKENAPPHLLEKDFDRVDFELESGRRAVTSSLEKNLYLLSTIATLAPFLGLLGTVWGILSSFSHLQVAGSTNQAVLSGLSLALATTVVGLIDAIPALVSYNFLKNEVKKFELEMEGFSTEMLSALETEYHASF
jgi:biopolymer transport protein TolQ